MAAKLNKESLIAIELGRLSDKIQEFQDYLEQNPIVYTLKKKPKDQDGDNMNKEIDTQIKMVNALFVWLPALSKLREVDEGKAFEARGGTQVNGMFTAEKMKDE